MHSKKVIPPLSETLKRRIASPKGVIPKDIHFERRAHWDKLLREESPTGHALTLQKGLDKIGGRFARLHPKGKPPTPSEIRFYAHAYIELAGRMADEISNRFRELNEKFPDAKIANDWNHLFAEFLWKNQEKIPPEVRREIKRQIISEIRSNEPLRVRPIKKSK